MCTAWTGENWITPPVIVTLPPFTSRTEPPTFPVLSKLPTKVQSVRFVMLLRNFPEWSENLLPMLMTEVMFTMSFVPSFI